MSTMQGQEEVVIRGLKCQDCGNQAKKDCSYSRCRTCCKSKGFKCQTHIRSTWVPVDRRRHKVEHPPLTTTLQGDIPKRHRHNPYSSMEELKFPGVMSSTALFSCVQVRSRDDTVNEIAYQTSVNIGGHVFSGLLYDQGPEQSFNYAIARGEGEGEGDPLHQPHSLNLRSASIHTHRDGTASATMPPLSVESFFPPHPFPLASFRPDMT